MPISAFSVIPHFINEVIHKKPRRVLDLGIGNGMYGALVRNYLGEVVMIDGVEGWKNYRNALWQAYNFIYECDIEDNMLLFNNNWYDCIIMADVIEHFEKEDGKDLIEKLKDKLAPGGIFLISTPAIFIDQNAVAGNKLEIHKSLWCLADFPGWTVLKDGAIDQFGHMMLAVKYTNA